MTAFETAFPGYVGACALLFRDLLPFGLFILIFGIALEFWHQPTTPEAMLKIYIRAFLILLLLLQSSQLINGSQDLIKEWVEFHIPARPENIAVRYQQRLREAQDLRDDADVSFVHKVLTGGFYEAIILAVLMLISWFAMAIVAIVYNVQRALLLGAWALSPLLIPCLAVRPIASIGLQHILRILGILAWPIGLAMASTFTEGLIEVISSGTTFSNVTFGQAVGKGLTGLLGIAVLAVWIILSTVLAPLYIQRLIAGSGAPFSVLMRSVSMAGSGLGSTVALLRSSISSSRSSGSANSGRRGFEKTVEAVTASAAHPIQAPPVPAPRPPSGPTPSPVDPANDSAVRAAVDRFKKSKS